MLVQERTLLPKKVKRVRARGETKKERRPGNESSAPSPIVPNLIAMAHSPSTFGLIIPNSLARSNAREFRVLWSERQ